MRIRLKGINSKRKKLADGSFKTYYWLGKGGPPLRGKPGTPEFVNSYNEAAARKVTPPSGKLLSLLRGYQGSEEFLKLAPRSRSDYIGKIKIIEKTFADFPLSAMPDPRTRGIFKNWRQKLAITSHRQADYAWTVLARALSWGLDRGLVAVNPCARGGRLYHGSRAEHIWTEADEAAFLAHARPHLHMALKLALWTGQRQGDLLRLPWGAYDGTYIRLRQSKTGARVQIRVGAPLKAALDSAPRRSPIILTTADGKPWREGTFRAAWQRACKAAGVVGVTFGDLRGTSVTRLALAGCTEAEIATITGHSMQGVRAILDVHYLARDPALGESAIRKLERRTKTPDLLPTALHGSDTK
jgi:integrase